MEQIAHKIEQKERTTDIKLSEKVSFSKMILSDSVRKGLAQSGYTYPTVIQSNAIPIGIAGIDLLIQSKSGTGKSLIFCTVLLEDYQSNVCEPQSLILAPTREIAVQIESNLNVLGKFSEGFKAVCVIGGLDVTNDRKRLQNAKAIVGTPGRVAHLIQNNVLNTSKIKLFIIDEADKMMSQTFRNDFQIIYNSLPNTKQLIACSATFCENLDKKLVKFMRNPLLISTDKRATLLVGIKQFICELPEEKTSILEMTAKLTMIKKIFTKISFKQCILFAGSQSRAESYCNTLAKDNWPCEVITGAQNQKIRLEIFEKFQKFKTRILIATDLMSRGIDSDNVNLVVNLEIPDDGPTYLHRIGRAGRFGSHGIAITFLSSEADKKKFSRILESIGNEIEILRFSEDNMAEFWNNIELKNDNSITFDKFEYDVNKENINTNKVNNLENPNLLEKNKKSNFLESLVDNKNTKEKISNNIFKDFEENVTNSDENQTELDEQKVKCSVPVSILLKNIDTSALSVEFEKKYKLAIQRSNDIKIPKKTVDLQDLLIDERDNVKNHNCENTFDDYQQKIEDKTNINKCISKQIEKSCPNTTKFKNCNSNKAVRKKPDLSKVKELLIDSDKSSENNIFDEYESLSNESNKTSQPNISKEENQTEEISPVICEDLTSKEVLIDYNKSSPQKILANNENSSSDLSTTNSEKYILNDLENEFNLFHISSSSTDFSTSSQIIHEVSKQLSDIPHNKTPTFSPSRPCSSSSSTDRELNSSTNSDDESTSLRTTSTSTESGTRSSGFIEKTSSGASSGIVTTTEYSENDDGDYNSTHSTNNSRDSSDLSSSSDDSDNECCIGRDRADHNSNCSFCYRKEFSNWTKQYKNQMSQIIRYANYYKMVENRKKKTGT